MNVLLIVNTVIGVAWISATVTLVMTGHDYWAVATFIAALFDYFTANRKIPDETDT